MPQNEPREVWIVEYCFEGGDWWPNWGLCFAMREFAEAEAVKRKSQYLTTKYRATRYVPAEGAA